MIDQPQASGAADEAKLELSMAAAAAERANKPRWIVVLGSLVLAATVIFALVSWQSRASVVSKVRTEQDKTRKILELKNQFDGETARLNARGTAPDPRMGQHIERLAASHGITLTPPQVQDSTANVMSQIRMQQHKYNAKAINQEPRAVLEWLRTVLTSSDTASLEITRLVIRPGAATPSGQPGWNIDVDFNRWESIKQ